MDVVLLCNTKKSNSKRIKIVRYLNQNNYFIQLYFLKLLIKPMHFNKHRINNPK